MKIEQNKKKKWFTNYKSLIVFAVIVVSTVTRGLKVIKLFIWLKENNNSNIKNHPKLK